MKSVGESPRRIPAYLFCLVRFILLSNAAAMVKSERARTASAFPRIVSHLNTEATLPTIKPESFEKTLVVHFDINETILVGDEAGGDTRDECLNKVIAKSSFVRLPLPNEESESQEPTEWWDGTPIIGDMSAGRTIDRSSSGSDPVDPIPPLYTGFELPENCCTYYKTAFKKDCKKFTQGHGRCYRPLYDLLQKEVAFNHPKEDLPPVLSHMIPAIFSTVRELVRRPQPCRIVFRTFGSDLPDIAKAITAFARGKHPDFPFVDPDWELPPINLFRGRWADEGKTYQLWSYDMSRLVAEGDQEIVDFLETRLMCGIQDDYHFWASRSMSPMAGKPVWVPEQNDVHHILLDDNIHNSLLEGIASVRKQDEAGKAFRTLSAEEILREQGRHLIRVPTLEPILNSNWFIDRIDEAQKQVDLENSEHLE